MTEAPRVALFADCFHEVNGVALTCRQWKSWAGATGRAMLAVHTGPAREAFPLGSVRTVELQRSPLAIPVDTDLAFDPLLPLRSWRRIVRELEAFRPSIVHITGPGDTGILGALAGHRFGVPITASWHTNLHEFGARRLARWTGEATASRFAAAALRGMLAYYRIPKLVFAPNPDLAALIRQGNGRPVEVMPRGIDSTLYMPSRRTRGRDGGFVFGFAGRLTPEKSVETLAAVDRGLRLAGVANHRFLILGHGSQREWLARELRNASLPGVLSGEALASAYADMDAFLFPSLTDTYGNAVAEAMACGVPAIVTASGGPRFLVRHGVDGWIAASTEDFVRRAVDLARSPERAREMGRAASETASRRSWHAVFENVWKAWSNLLCETPSAMPIRGAHPPAPGLAG